MKITFRLKICENSWGRLWQKMFIIDKVHVFKQALLSVINKKNVYNNPNGFP